MIFLRTKYQDILENYFPFHYLGIKQQTLSYEFCDDYCLYCNQVEKEMAAVPQGAFAAKKVRQNEDKLKAFQRNTDPMNYSSKYMNSIWGQYNRYSVHNLKKIMDVEPLVMSLKKPAEKIAVFPTPVNFTADIGSSLAFQINKMFS